MLQTSSARKLLAVLALLLPPAAAQERLGAEPVDQTVIERIKAAESGSNGASKIADIASTLADLYGPRLANSPQFRRAADWAVQQLRDWGLANVHKETWTTPAARPLPSWQCTFFSASMVEPVYQPLIAVPEAWSPATDGSIEAQAMLLVWPRSLEELERMRGTLQGKMLLVGGPAKPLPLPETVAAHRFSREELATLALDPIPAKSPVSPPSGGPGISDDLLTKILDWFHREPPLAQFRNGGVFQNDPGDEEMTFQGGTVFGWGFVNASAMPHARPTAILAAEHYNRIARLLARHVPVKLQLEIRTERDDSYQSESFNVIAEIPGSAKPQEVVMAGAHLDSWPYATGATDNAIGCAAAMEAMRILRSLDLRMDRTVRLALWSGEEEGLLGSRAYVRQHYAVGPGRQGLKPEHETFSVYFNLDAGSGEIRGVWLEHNAKARPVFEAWFSALNDPAAGTVSIRDAGRGISDHQAFDAAGLPAFAFIQDPLDFDTRARHTNMDTLDRIQWADAEQMAVVLASFLYQAATRADLVPRKEPGGSDAR
ncbi:MAG TPA: M20/M25/M40 family metallo-hydrolase [Bryobacteraceae bacterium]|nr:M20/M25/M40 family metallo-hydrolase [Bryobacteraceae bacterium]